MKNTAHSDATAKQYWDDGYLFPIPVIDVTQTAKWRAELEALVEGLPPPDEEPPGAVFVPLPLSPHAQMALLRAHTLGKLERLRGAGAWGGEEAEGAVGRRRTIRFADEEEAAVAKEREKEAAAGEGEQRQTAGEPSFP